MKKLFISVIMLLFLSVPASYASNIGDDLLRNDQAKMFFGELMEPQGDFTVIKPIYNIKGEFDPDTLIRVFIDHCEIMGGQTAEIGKIYLCGLSSDQKNLYLWEFDTMDTSIIRLKATDSFSKEIRRYLNQGLFDKAEQDRLYQIHLHSRPKVSAAAPAQSNETITLPVQSAQKQLKTIAWPWAAAICAGITTAAVILYVKRR